jgi:hypothetical protein
VQVLHSLHMVRVHRLSVSAHQGVAQLFLSYVLWSLGGSTLCSVLLGQPPGWLAADRVCCCYVVAFSLMYCLPYGRPLLSLLSTPVVDSLLLFGQDLAFAHAITSFGVDRALLSPSSLFSVSPLYPSHTVYSHPATHLSFFSALAAALLSSTGGGLLCDTFQLLGERWEFSFPHKVLSPPSHQVHMAVWLTVLYYTATNPHGWIAVTAISRDEARMLVTVAVVCMVSGRWVLCWLAHKVKVSCGGMVTCTATSLQRLLRLLQVTRTVGEERTAGASRQQAETGRDAEISEHAQVVHPVMPTADSENKRAGRDSEQEVDDFEETESQRANESAETTLHRRTTPGS